jgi:hypothetical protein
MKMRSAFLCILLLSIATAAQSQSESVAAKTATMTYAPILGVWRAEADGLPFITLTITDEGGSLSGAILFYMHRRDEGKPIASTPGIPEPLLNPSFDGKILTFQVSHRHAHPPRTLSDPPVTFRLKLTGTNTAGLFMGELTNQSESSTGFPLVKTDY